jgi:deoxyribonuclease V
MSERPFSRLVQNALADQRALPDQFLTAGFPRNVRYVGGADAAFAPGPAGQRAGAVGSLGLAVAVVWDITQRKLVEARFAATPVTFPYVPGLLSYREHPLLAAAIGQVKTAVDVWMFDGHGQSHPRRAGLATHMGVALDMPAIGAAKSILIGTVGTPVTADNQSAAPLLHDGKEIARELRLAGPDRDPIYISQGHRCTLDQAVALALACNIGKPLPAPTWYADRLSHRAKKLTPAAARQLIENFPHDPSR